MPSYISKILYLLPKTDPLKLVGLFCMMLTVALFEIIGIGLIPLFVSIISNPDEIERFPYFSELTSYFNLKEQGNLLKFGAVALIALFIIKNSYIIFYYYIETRFVYNRRFYISKKLVNHYLKAPYHFHLKRNSAELLRNVTQEVSILISKVIKPSLEMLKEAVITISIITFLFILEPLITTFVILLLGSGTGLFLFATQKKIKSYGKEEQGIRTGMIKALNEGVGGIKEARILNRELEFAKRFDIAAKRSSSLMSYVGFASKIPKPVVETIAVIGMMSIALLMVWQDRSISAIVPVLTLFAIATVRMMPSIQGITATYTQLKYNIVAIDPIYDDLKELESSNSTFDSQRMNTQKLLFSERLEVQNVSFSYEKSDLQAVKNITFHVKKGAAVAFAGKSGAGKSTIVDLILGLMNPTQGVIRVDGFDIKNNLSGWQKNIGYIPQSIYLSDDSLKANIAFGIPEIEIDITKVIKAIQLAQLEDLVATLPDGLNTRIGESGTRLSGGQRQRVGIARALYEDPDVIIMDEATSALDNITEKLIIESIEKLKGERTVIMIAHRLTTVMNCDTIHLMEEGEIISSGTYDSLINNSSKFRKMALKE